ncbi:DUF7678 domain-containing protein [Alloscardovia sp. HMSC034E08]|uniref:DUF7678 domain-containing protein n=1 Tax=Alloscardovia sp. HMSC034E08 TaxID=1739413 RepID=UPI0008C70E76|nr:hypothetical protein [Alloscardovia sp. HMSC034E08]OFQ99755.1 hypothetical protein HMPREF2909_06030 [Alloscardovia sp. HMSC034E08]
MWEQGTFEVEDQVISYSMKVFEEASDYGINKGRISKLTLKNNNKVIANYDRGWDIMPTDKIANEALEMILDARN